MTTSSNFYFIVKVIILCGILNLDLLFFVLFSGSIKSTVSCDNSTNSLKVQSFLPYPSLHCREELPIHPKKVDYIETSFDSNIVEIINQSSTERMLSSQTLRCHAETQTNGDMCSNNEPLDCEYDVNTLRNTSANSQTERLQMEQICENCKNNNNTSTVNSEKIEELDRMISDLKIKEKLYEQTMSEADDMFSNMTLEYRIQIENLENQLNATSMELKVMKRELDKEREENDRMSNGQVDLMKQIKVKEGEKKQLSNMLECIKLQLEEEREVRYPCVIVTSA